jgi:hypothetical protein
VHREYTIITDTREQTPLPFPSHLPLLDPNRTAQARTSLTVKLGGRTQKLDAGDYALEGYERICLVERKGSIRELAKNCLTADRTRFIAALDRLRAACLHPYVLVEGTLTDMAQDPSIPDWWTALDSLQRLLLERNIGLILLPNKGAIQRRMIGEWVARLLVNSTLCPILPAITPEEPSCPTMSSLSPPTDPSISQQKAQT